ncbi:hypothetical protein ACLOJK_007083 [Asimina triloba]
MRCRWGVGFGGGTCCLYLLFDLAEKWGRKPLHLTVALLLCSPLTMAARDGDDTRFEEETRSALLTEFGREAA